MKATETNASPLEPSGAGDAPRAASRASLAVIFLAIGIDLLGFGIVLPLQPIYTKQLAQHSGLGHAGVPIVLAALMTSFTIMQFFFAPLWGRLSDRIGRRPVLLISLAGSTIFYALFGLATRWSSLTLLFVSRIGAGIAGATIPTAQAYIADVTPRANRARGMALIGAAFGLGFTFGPLIGALALSMSQDGATNPWPGYVASLLSLAALGLAYFKLGESLNPEAAQETRRHFDFQSLRLAMKVPSIPILLLTGFLTVFALANLESTLSLSLNWLVTGKSIEGLRAQDLGIAGWKILLAFAYIGLVQSLVQGLVVRRMAKFLDERVLVTIGGTLAIVGYLVLALATNAAHPSLTLFLVGVAVEVSGIGFLIPSIQSLISRRSDPTEQGGIFGLSESLSSMARIGGVWCAMQLLFWRQDAPFWNAAAIMCVTLVLVLVAAARGRDWGERRS